MKRVAIAAAACLASACAMSDTPAPEPTGEAAARLSEALAGRTAGNPVACIQRREMTGNTPIDERTILFRGTGDVVWVNRTRSACGGIRPWHAIRFRTLGTSLCANDLITAYDAPSGMEYGGCSLGEFVPYRRTR